MGDKLPRKFWLVNQAFEIESEGWLRRIIENPCVGGSIPPRATKKHQNHLRVVFLLGLGYSVLGQIIGRLIYWLRTIICNQSNLYGNSNEYKISSGCYFIISY